MIHVARHPESSSLSLEGSRIFKGFRTKNSLVRKNLTKESISISFIFQAIKSCLFQNEPYCPWSRNLVLKAVNGGRDASATIDESITGEGIHGHDGRVA